MERNFSAGLSKLQSTCTEDYFEKKSIFLKELLQNCFRNYDEKTSTLFSKFQSTCAGKYFEEKIFIKKLIIFFLTTGEKIWT